VKASSADYLFVLIWITLGVGANKYKENQGKSRKIGGDLQALVLLMVSLLFHSVI
jgi:hypothetical protein